VFPLAGGHPPLPNGRRCCQQAVGASATRHDVAFGAAGSFVSLALLEHAVTARTNANNTGYRVRTMLYPLPTSWFPRKAPFRLQEDPEFGEPDSPEEQHEPSDEKSAT
jgi:hypothetical protein